MYLLPLAAFTWVGRRTGLAWTAVALALVGGFWWLGQSHAASLGLTPIREHAHTLPLLHGGMLLAIGALAAAFAGNHEYAEQRLAADRRRLEHAVAQSRRAEHKAELEARSQAAFIAMTSHELRTPMHAALGSAALLMETELSSEQRGYITTIHHSGQALLEVINDILDYSKIEANSLTLEQRPFSLRQTLETVGEMLAPMAHAKNLEMVLDLAPNLPEEVSGDPTRLRQIVLNLVGNALKFTERGEIVVSARQRDPGRVLIVVQDTGVGMSESQIDRVFDAFAQAEANTAARFGGTGLGLTIARRLAQLMDGDVHVYSRPGVGSRFEIAITLHELAANSPATTKGPELRGVVLIVDDHPKARAQIASQLEAWGIAYREAPDASTARDILQNSSPYDAVLIDEGLPGAAELLDRIAAPTRLIVLRAPGATAHEPLTDSPQAASVDKPVRRQALHEALEGTLESPQVGTQGRPRQVSTDAPLVLIADDNTLNANLAAQIVQRHGYRSEVVGTGRQVLERVSEGGVDMVLMDCQMPEMDGCEAARHLRLNASAVNMPIVALTAHTLDSEIKRLLDAGMNDWLIKPYTLDSLSDVLARWCPLPADQREETPCTITSSGEMQTAFDAAFDQLRRYVPTEQAEDETRKLLHTFVDKAQSRLAHLHEALYWGHTASMHREAHALRGTLGFMGLLTACDRCAELTSLTLPEDHERATQCVDDVAQALLAIQWTTPMPPMDRTQASA